MLLLVPLEDGTRRVVYLSQGCLLKLATGESLAGGNDTVTGEESLGD